MKSLAGHTILVTGGASGIGFALASRFAKAGSTVIICGRREDQLEWAKKQVPALITVRGDVSTDTGRVALFEKVSKEYPKVDMLVNNAGIQNRLPPLTVEQDWSKYKSEIAINYEAPIHLTMLFLPHFMKLEAAYIMNVTSGLSFVPLSFLAGYSATKAGMHSFTLSLRHQLKDTKVKVIECIPPAVNTDLGGKGFFRFCAKCQTLLQRIMLGRSLLELPWVSLYTPWPHLPPPAPFILRHPLFNR